uniref:Pre-B-cell leukemia homeobox interacting protein 1b n=2 Tax=Astyanax mexicanus TaxID=7994 RepID=A0A8B9I0D1_ASTMX
MLLLFILFLRLFFFYSFVFFAVAGQSHWGAMADNSSGTNGNSWTILTPEVKEPGVESVGPLAEGLEGPVHSEPAQPRTDQQDLENLSSHRSDLTDGPTEHNSAPDPPQVVPLETNEAEASVNSSHLKDSSLSASPVEILTCLSSDLEQQDERETALNLDAESFSDSYSHISSGTASAPHPAAASQEEEGLSAGEESLELRKTLREESSPDVDVSEEQEVEGDGLRRRKVPQLSPEDHRDEDEEEEAEEEPFTPPRREDDAGFSLNKCIFGAVILLGLGTIFFSEGDAEVQELKDPHLKKEWMNLDASGNTPASVPPLEVLEQLAKESQKIAILQAQFQEQEGELKATQLQVEEGSRERVKRKELEVEIQKMRGELDKLPALQKELEQGNERAKKDLEALPALQKELELLKARVTELTQSTDGAQSVTLQSESATPSAGPGSELPSSQGKKEWKDKKSQEKVKKEKEWKEGKKDKEEGKLWKDRGNEGKEPKKQKEREKKVQREESKEYRAKGERKVGEDEKEGKKGRKQEEGKRWKDSEVKRDSKDEGKKRERKEDDKRWKDDKDKVKRESGEENEKEDKKYKKKEKPWQLDGERGGTKTKERKHFGEKVKEGKDERDWEKRRQTGSDDKKEWKEKRKDGKERNEWDTEEGSHPKGEGGKAKKKESWKGEKDHHHRGKKERKERDERDAENENEGNERNERKPKSERKAHKKDSWKEEKNHNREGTGDKNAWKERNEWDAENERIERKDKKQKKKDWKERNEWDAENAERIERNDKKQKKDWKERNEWDAENERNAKGERKSHKKDSWKEEKEGNGGKKEWKERTDKRSSGKEREWPKNEEKEENRKQHKGEYEKNGERWSRKDKSRNPSPEKEPHHLYTDRQQSEDQSRAGDYWAEQRERIRHFRGSTEGCDGVTACARAEGLSPVSKSDFESFLSTYLEKLRSPENKASKKEELNKLISEFFTNGVFIHDQIPFSEFVEDVADILEDMAEEEEEDKEVEDEMEEFEREAMEKFALQDRGGEEEKRRESGRKRASG